jgi:hypothetical protein
MTDRAVGQRTVNAKLYCRRVCRHMSYPAVKSRIAARSGWRKMTSMSSMSVQLLD